MNDHSSTQFDLDLENIRTRVLRMGGLVEQQVMAAIEALSNGNLDEMQQVIATDRQVDADEIEVDEHCTRLIARRQPTAGDLRLVMAISRIVTDLERVGDKAAKIAKMSMQLAEMEHRHLLRIHDLRGCSTIAIAMLRGALDALARKDLAGARRVIATDAEIDAQFNALLRQTIASMSEDPRLIGEGLDRIWIAKAIERIGDHACNIAENVIYMISGVDVRHQDLSEAALSEAPRHAA